MEKYHGIAESVPKRMRRSIADFLPNKQRDW
jgi:hypothetical protein